MCASPGSALPNVVFIRLKGTMMKDYSLDTVALIHKDFIARAEKRGICLNEASENESPAFQIPRVANADDGLALAEDLITACKPYSPLANTKRSLLAAKHLLGSCLVFTGEYLPDSDLCLKSIPILIGMEAKAGIQGYKSPLHVVFDEIRTGMRHVKIPRRRRDGDTPTADKDNWVTCPSAFRRATDKQRPYDNIKPNGSRGFTPLQDPSLYLYSTTTKMMNADSSGAIIAKLVIEPLGVLNDTHEKSGPDNESEDELVMGLYRVNKVCDEMKDRARLLELEEMEVNMSRKYQGDPLTNMICSALIAAVEDISVSDSKKARYKSLLEAECEAKGFMPEYVQNLNKVTFERR